VSIPAHLDPVVIDCGQRTLSRMAELATSLVYASVLTEDGFEIAALAGSSIDGGRFASMSSSMQALSDAVARELDLGATNYLITSAPGGHVIQLRVPGEDWVLAALFDHHETLGKGLSVSRISADYMSSLMEEASVGY
jgi:predicted regulator of Ras-like GTPase activity (Roadblock/LC7/MglB family)